MADDRLLTVQEVAERLRLKPETVRRWLRSGRLRGISLGSDHAGWRVRESEVQKFLGGDPDVKRAA
jgi:excisionase family DNA binding protein